MRQHSLALILVASALAVGCATGGINSSEGWSAVKSKHFTVYAGTPRNTQLGLASLEYAYAGFRSAFFKGVDVGTVDVLFLEEQDYNELMGFLRPGAALAKVPGGGIGANGLIILKEDIAGTAAAEALAHLFIDKAFPKAPLWFHEGFASYLRTAEYREGGDQRATCFGVPKGDTEPLVPLDKMLTAGWDDYDGDEMRSWYRYTARMVFDYLLHGENRKNRERLNGMVAAVAEGKSGPEVFEAAFPNVAPAAFGKKLGEHGADVAYQAKGDSKVRGLCPLGFPILPEHLPDQGDREITPAPPAAIKALLEAVHKLPRRDGYPPWYPAEVLDRPPAR